MESQSPEYLWIGRKKEIAGELVRGREFATQLKILLNKSAEDHGSVTADDLLEKIVISFTEALSVLNSPETSEVCQNPAITGVNSPCCDDRRSEDSGESRKTLASKDRRGGYKRRKTSQTWTKLTQTPIDDGHAWRKYGQKEILNAKFPRSYFRCTHRNDQGCAATKQVQRTEDDPPMYRTIYMGNHTCKDMLKAPQLILDSAPPIDQPYLLSFGIGNNIVPSNKPEHPFFSSLSSIKQECKEEILSDPTHNNNQSSSKYIFSTEDLTTFETSVPTTMFTSTPGSETGDVISGVYSSCSSSFDIGMMVGSVDFDDVFQFDEEEFFYAHQEEDR